MKNQKHKVFPITAGINFKGIKKGFETNSTHVLPN